MEVFHEWAEGLDLIVVVEEKRKLIEVQVKEAIFDDRRGRRVYGWHKGDSWEHGRQVELFPTRYALDPIMIAEKLGEILIEEGRGTDAHDAPGCDGLTRRRQGRQRARRSRRGCPISARAVRTTPRPRCRRAPRLCRDRLPLHGAVDGPRRPSGFTQMGGEGANWVGEAPFSKRDHVFQNLGDGTYNHSGVQAIRAALAAGTNITYKILFNDAVAMTGGQTNEGGLTADRIVREMQAMGVENIAVVYDEKEDVDPGALPRRGSRCSSAPSLMPVQEKFSKIKGVSAIVYIQTCAAEKRRRRKRGDFPGPRQAGLHQHRCLRRLRRLRGAVELRLDRAGGDRTGPQAGHRPVVLQQGFLLPQRVLPVVRDA